MNSEHFEAKVNDYNGEIVVVAVPLLHSKGCISIKGILNSTPRTWTTDDGESWTETFFTIRRKNSDVSVTFTGDDVRDVWENENPIQINLKDKMEEISFDDFDEE